jgi:tetratricopeptide (TPR) repeat protein
VLAQDVAWLTDELLRAAADDPLVRARLEIAAGADVRSAYDDRAMRENLEQAISIRDFVDYHEAHSYFRHVDGALDGVAELIGKGFANVAVELAEYALELLEEAAERVDDSAGGLGEALRRAEEIHLAACSAGGPDPVRLAERLAGRALTGDFEVFLTAMPDYEPVLGPAGMARYQELIEEAWDVEEPGFAAKHLMERLAECQGGTKALIEVLSRDVSSAYNVSRIAERLVQDSRDEEALDWLRRGLNEFPGDARLRVLAASCHSRAGRPVEACELLWENFAARPVLENFAALSSAAGDEFSLWRTRALGLLRAEPSCTGWFTGRPYEPARHSTLVQVFLWEGDTEAAWSAATTGGCRDELWLQVGRERARSHPAEAIPILLAAAEQAIGGKSRGHYQRAAQYLVEARELFKRCGQTADFKAHLNGLRAAHKSKRALREELDRAGLP